MLLVTGGCSFVGSAFVLDWVGSGGEVVNLDLLTYSGHLDNVRDIAHHERYHFIHGDIADQKLLSSLLTGWRPRAVVKTTDYHYPAHERSLAWNDQKVDIAWPRANGTELVMSRKDAKAPAWQHCPLFERQPPQPAGM